mgnify:CR=1 FL=1
MLYMSPIGLAVFTLIAAVLLYPVIHWIITFMIFTVSAKLFSFKITKTITVVVVSKITGKVLAEKSRTRSSENTE